MTTSEKSSSNAGWKHERQPSPPYFGQARRATWLRLLYEAYRRRLATWQIRNSPSSYCDFEPERVSIVVLSCKRLDELTRLVSSVNDHFSRHENRALVETVLVDNGSGPHLVDTAKSWNFFDRIVAFEENLGMAVALDRVFPTCLGEFILLLEDDFVLIDQRPFLDRCRRIFKEFPEIGIIRLKNQNNWWKPIRVIAPERQTSDGTKFWTWLPSRDGTSNVWAAGSVLFRKLAFCAAGPIPVGPNVGRDNPKHQGALYELEFGKIFNRFWLAAKLADCQPFFQPNDGPPSPGWGAVTTK